MQTPLIVALSRQLSVKDQMTVIANNIANMTTGGYKAERLTFRNYVARTNTGDTVTFPQQAGIHRLYNAGPINRTANPLDLALRGDGYLVVQGSKGLNYTRNGHLSLDAQGQVVTTQGFPILDSNDRPIVIDSGAKDITISDKGKITVDGNTVGQLKIVKFDDNQSLVRVGGSLFKNDKAGQPATEVTVVQGSLEGSNVEPVIEITRFMNATGSYQAAKKIVDDEDDRQRHAIQQLGSLPQ